MRAYAFKRAQSRAFWRFGCVEARCSCQVSAIPEEEDVEAAMDDDTPRIATYSAVHAALLVPACISDAVDPSGCAYSVPLPYLEVP